MFGTVNNVLIYKWVMIFIAFLLCFSWLGKKGVFPWDEARYGENAYWMNEKGDFVNYYFANQPDYWNAKPPLANWLIALNYRWLGHNPWALRLHSALAGVLFFALFFAWVQRYRSPLFAATACLILFSVRGIIGHHLSRTGDTDALLLLFLMGFLYAFSVWSEEGKKSMLWWGALSLGLAFYAKGTTMVFYLPGALLVLLAQRKLTALLKEPHFWGAAALLVALVGSWFGLVQALGHPYENPDFPGANRWEALLLYDTLQRFTEAGVEGVAERGREWGFVFSALDIKFNLWHYPFWGAVLLGLWRLGQNRFSPGKWLLQDQYRIYFYSLCLGGSLALVLTFSQSKLVWYISPVLPFAAVGTTAFLFWSVRQWAQWRWLWLALWLFAMGRQIWYLYRVPETPSQFVYNQRAQLAGAERIYLYQAGTQEMQLYADWYAREVYPLSRLSSWQGDGIVIGYISETERKALQAKTGFTAECETGFCILRGKPPRD